MLDRTRPTGLHPQTLFLFLRGSEISLCGPVWPEIPYVHLAVTCSPLPQVDDRLSC